MKKLITANDIREAHARGEQAMSVVLRASIITPEAREVADLLGFTITECDESIPVTASVPASVPADKTESQRIRETIIAQLPEGQFTESLVAQLMEKVMKEKQSLEQGAMQPSFKSVTGKGGIKVIDGSSVKFGRFDGAQPHCQRNGAVENRAKTQTRIAFGDHFFRRQVSQRVRLFCHRLATQFAARLRMFIATGQPMNGLRLLLFIVNKQAALLVNKLDAQMAAFQ